MEPPVDRGGPRSCEVTQRAKALLKGLPLKILRRQTLAEDLGHLVFSRTSGATCNTQLALYPGSPGFVLSAPSVAEVSSWASIYLGDSNHAN